MKGSMTWVGKTEAETLLIEARSKPHAEALLEEEGLNPERVVLKPLHKVEPDIK